MSLYVQAVAQPQMTKFIVRHFPVEKAARLIAELGDSFADQAAVDAVVAVHHITLAACEPAG